MSQNYPGHSGWQGGQQPPPGVPQQHQWSGQQHPQFGPQGPQPPHSYGPGPGFGTGGRQGPGYPPSPGFGPAGSGYPPGPVRKSKTALFIGIGAGAFVLIVGLAVLAFFLLNQSQNLSAAQFEQVFAKGDPVGGSTIESRDSSRPEFDESVDTQCEKKVVEGFTTAENWMSAYTSQGSVVMVGVRFADGGAATRAFDAFDGPCEGDRKDSGEAEGGKYVIITFEGSDAVLVKTGNVIVLAVSRASTLSNKALGGEIAKEVRNSAK